MANKPGTAPNTSLILTDDELAYINQQFGGGKSAAIHTALGAMMNTDKKNRVLDTWVGGADIQELAANPALETQIAELIAEGWDAMGLSAQEIADIIRDEAAKVEVP